MGFSRQEYWSVLPFSSPGDLPGPGIKLVSPALAGRFFTTEPPGKPPHGQANIQISGCHAVWPGLGQMGQEVWWAEGLLGGRQSQGSSPEELPWEAAWEEVHLEGLAGVYSAFLGLLRWLSGKESTSQWRGHRICEFDPWVGKIPLRRKWQPAPVFLPGKFHGQRSLVGRTPWGCKESDTTEWLSMHAYRYNPLNNELGHVNSPFWVSFIFLISKWKSLSWKDYPWIFFHL